MWMQAIAIILPRVQRHFALPDNQIGLLSSAMFAGMMFGAVGWELALISWVAALRSTRRCFLHLSSA